MFRALTSGDLRGLSTAFFVLFHSVFIFYVLFVFFFIFFVSSPVWREVSRCVASSGSSSGNSSSSSSSSARSAFVDQWLSVSEEEFSVKELSREDSERIPLFRSHLHNQNVMGTRIMGKIQLKLINGQKFKLLWCARKSGTERARLPFCCFHGI